MSYLNIYLNIYLIGGLIAVMLYGIGLKIDNETSSSKVFTGVMLLSWMTVFFMIGLYIGAYIKIRVKK